MTAPPLDDLDKALARIRTGRQGGTSGLLQPGNVDLTNRPRVKNTDGSVSTVRSMSFNQDGKEILVPTVSDDGRIMSNEEAVASYQKTGKHLGIFRDPASATAYAQQLHEQQAKTLQRPGDMDAALAKMRATTPHGASGSWGDEPVEPSGPIDNASRALLEGATFGMSPKLVAAGNAVVDKLHGEPFGASYRTRLADERQASSQFRDAHPLADIALQATGGIGGAVAMGGLNPGADAQAVANVGRLARMAKAAKTAGALGAASGAVNEDGSIGDRISAAATHGLTAAVAAPLLSIPLEAGGYLLGKTPIPRLASQGAAKIAGVLPSGSMAQRALQSASQTIGPQGKAATTIAERAGMDAKAGFQPPTQAPGVPALALDQAGPNVEGLAKGIVRTPGAGGATIRGALESRAGQMRPGVTQAIEDATGVPANAGLTPLRNLVRTQREQGNFDYSQARAATEGQPITSDVVGEIIKTPVGAQAAKWAQVQKAVRMRASPTMEGTPPKPPIGFGISPEQWTALQAKMTPEQRAQLPGTEPGEPVIDAEALHYMKQYLAKVARLGVHDGASGATATQAQGALELFNSARDVLPPEWQTADANFAANARKIDMMNQGRSIFRTTENPPGKPKAALYNSLSGLDQRIASADQPERDALQTGAGMASQSRWAKVDRSVSSPGRVFDFSSPERAQQMSYAFKTPEAGQQFENTISGWDRAAAQKQRILGGSDTKANLAESDNRDAADLSLLAHLLHGNIGSALRTGVGKVAASGRAPIDDAIAQMLTSPNIAALPQAQRTALIRQRVQDLLTRSAGGFAATETNQR